MDGRGAAGGEGMARDGTTGGRVTTVERVSGALRDRPTYFFLLSVAPFLSPDQMPLVSRFIAALVFVVVAAAPAAAQFSTPAAPCPEGTAEAQLRGTDVEAALFTNGNLFFGGTTTNGDGYIVPLTGEDAGNSPIFASNLWIGGTVGGEVRTAAARYNSFQLRPGRTGPGMTPPDSSACAAADRIWILSQDGRGLGDTPEDDVREWPVALGAPVIDGDGIEGNYDLAAGDRPGVRGDAMAFWSMTDTAAERREGELPLGVDVRAEAFVIFALPTTTFYHFTITNRNTIPVEGTAVGFYFDPDLGDATDDYVGTDTTNAMAYVYNAGETDRAYGVPPAAGVVVARGPLAEANGRDDDRDGEVDEVGERMGLTSAALIYKSAGVDTFGEPTIPSAYYNRLLGLSGDGTFFRAYGDGFSNIPTGTPTTRFAFTGDPVTEAFWSNENIDGTGTDLSLGDKRGIASTGPVDLAPGESMEVTFAVVFAQGEDRLDSVVKLRGQAEIVRRVAESGAFEPVALRTLPEPVVSTIPLTLRRPYPNPFSDAATIEIRESGSGTPAVVRISVYDTLGRRVMAPVETVVTPEARVEVGRGLAAGVYVVRVEGTGFAEAFPIVKIR